MFWGTLLSNWDILVNSKQGNLLEIVLCLCCPNKSQVKRSNYDQNFGIFQALPELKIHMKDLEEKIMSSRWMIFPNCHHASDSKFYPSPLGMDIHQRPQKETKKNWKHATNDSAKPSPASGNETHQFLASRNKKRKKNDEGVKRRRWGA